METRVAVAVIGLLASLAMPSLKTARNSSLNKTKISKVRTLPSATEMWAMDSLVPDGTPIRF